MISFKTDRKGRRWLVLTIAERFHFSLKLHEAGQLYNELKEALTKGG
jgi:hypothetical protein